MESMRKMNLRNSVNLLFVCLLSSQFAIAQPFQGWRGPNRDGIYNETGLLKSWPAEGPQLLWETVEAGKGNASPVIVDNKIFITGLNEDGDKEVFSAFTIDGKRIYQTTYGNPWKESFSETRTTPTLVGDKAYVISGMGEVVCLNTANGEIVWTVDGEKEFGRKTGTWGVSESPLVFDGKVIYSPGGDKTAVVALDAATGKTIWQSKPYGETSTYVSPLLINHKGKREIIGMTGHHVIALNPDNGHIEWDYDGFAKEKKIETDGKISTNTPLFKDGHLFICNGYDVNSFMLELNDDASAVKLLWENKDLDTHHGGFVLINGIIYGSNWTNNNQGNWGAVDWNTGETKYDNAWTGGKGKGSVIAADGMLYCYDERRGTVGLVKPVTDKFDVVSEFRITKGEGPYWAHLVIQDGVLYARHGSVLMAYKIK
jgi:outer membrane protein assembly factor BamB